MGSETDTIKERLDLAEVVGEYVALKQMGQHFKGLCPFHQEKTPSFIVSPDKGIWHCFGCGKGGDLFSFIQEKEGVDFSAALRMLADRAGVQLRPVTGAAAHRSGGKQRLFDILALAARFYHEVLLRQKAGKRALEYLVTERGVSRDVLRQFQVGYAPHQWDTILSFLRSRGYSPAEVQAAGLAGENSRGTLYDRFRGRIMFPIADTSGRVVAFGGRIAPWHATGNEGKYVNSPETALYEKRRIVYNLDRAKRVVHAEDPLVVVEGYLDVLLATQVGVTNVVATSGTALTHEHVTQLARFTRRLHFAFDADTAGVKAALSATGMALHAGLRVATILLPSGTDPADMAQAQPDAFRAAVEEPRSLVSVLFEQLQRADSGESREVWFSELLSVVRLVANPVQQGEMVQELAALLHVPESQIIASLQKQARVVSSYQPARSDDAVSSVAPHASPVRLDYALLGLAIISPGVRSLLMQELGRDEISSFDQSSVALYNVLQGLVTTSPQQFETLSADDMLARVPPELLSFAEGVRRIAEERLAHSADGPEAEGALLVRRLRQQSLAQRLRVLREDLGSSDGAARDQALQQFREVTEALAHLDIQR